MTVITELTIPPTAFSLGELMQIDDDIYIDVTHVVSGEHSIDLYLWLTGTDQAAFETAVRADSRTTSMTRLDHMAGKAVYRLTLEGEHMPLVAAIQSGDLLVETIRGRHDQWRFRLRAADYNALAAFSEVCDDLGVPVDIQRISTADTHENPGYSITEKQYEVLRLAFEEGYFSVPRQTTLTKLAHSLGISDSAVAQRLRRGLTTLLADTLFPTLQPTESDE